MSTFRTRLAALAAAALITGAGLGVRAVLAWPVAKYAGDALYTVLMFALVVAVAPRIRPLAAAAVALAISWAAEFFQLTGVPAELSRHSVLARLVLGSTFGSLDLLWYAVGAATAAAAYALAVGRPLRRRATLGA